MPIHNPPTPTPEHEDVWNLAVLASEVGSIDERLSNLEESAETTNERLSNTNELLGKLVEIQTRRDNREEEELTVERERRKASAEAELIQVQASVTERSARGAWLRGLVTKDLLLPIVSAACGVLAAWAAGRGMGPSQGVVVNQPTGQAATTFVTGASEAGEPATVITVPSPAPAPVEPAPTQLLDQR